MFDQDSNCINTSRSPDDKLRVFIKCSKFYRNKVGEEFVEVDLTRGDIIALGGQMDRLDQGKM